MLLDNAKKHTDKTVTEDRNFFKISKSILCFYVEYVS